MLFEIVPNFSEGRDSRFVDAAMAAAENVGARVLHHTADAVHHRSVLTIAGDGDAVVAAAVALAALARDRIDLRGHQGAHPRIGALDVLPFVPLRRATLTDAVTLAHRAGAAIWTRVGVPCFYYDAASRHAPQRSLPQVRHGGFEGLAARFAAGERPDQGDIAMHPTAGAIAIGARGLLIAYNIALATGDITHARAIARRLRESSGGLRTLRALAFPIDADRTQVSFNLTDPEALPLYRVAELVERLAAQRGIATLGGELIGCLPLRAVETTAHYYLGVLETP